jgi:hypothetical protein
MEKFTKNFSAGKDSPPSPKTSSGRLISGRFGGRTAIFSADHDRKMPARQRLRHPPIHRISR